MPYLITYLHRTLIFEWDVVWHGSKNGYRKETCSKEIGLRAQNMITILNPIVNVIEGGGWVMSMGMEKLFI